MLTKYEADVERAISLENIGESRAVAIITGIVKNKQPKPLGNYGNAKNEDNCLSDYVREPSSTSKPFWNLTMDMYELEKDDDDDGELPF